MCNVNFLASLLWQLTLTRLWEKRKNVDFFISWHETKSDNVITELLREVQEAYIVKAQLKFSGERHRQKERRGRVWRDVPAGPCGRHAGHRRKGAGAEPGGRAGGGRPQRRPWPVATGRPPRSRRAVDVCWCSPEGLEAAQMWVCREGRGGGEDGRGAAPFAVAASDPRVRHAPRAVCRRGRRRTLAFR